MSKSQAKKASGAKGSDRKKTGWLQSVLLVVLVIAVIVSIVSTQIMRGQWKRSEVGMRVADENLELAFGELDAVFSAIMRTRMRGDYAISEEGYEILNKARAYYTKFAELNAENAALRPARARALRLLGQILQLQNQVRQAELAYSESRSVYSQVVMEHDQPELNFYLAEVNNHLTQLLASVGRVDEAVQSGTEAMSRLAMLAKDHPNVPRNRSELAVAYNNLGLLAAAAGRDDDGSHHLRQYSLILEQLSEEYPENVDYFERLIDSQQVLSYLLCRAGDVKEARDVSRQSLASIEILARRVEEFDFISLDFNTSREMALVNHKRIEDALAPLGGPLDKEETRKSSSGRPAYLSWNWKPLANFDGKTIRPDMLVKGALPADFDRHDALLLGFDWKNKAWQMKSLIEIVAATWDHIQIKILVPDAVAQEMLTDALRKTNVKIDRIQFVQLQTDSPWIRDYGPFVIQTSAESYNLVDANCLPDRFHDDHVPLGLGRLLRMPNVHAPIFLEGGNLLTNGDGLCIATHRLLQRNQQQFGYDATHVTSTIKRLFGAKEVIYLETLTEERTGHVDWFATFTSTDTVVVGDYTGIDPVNAEVLDRNAQQLAKVKTSAGPLKVVRIPMPPRGKDFFGGTYTNVVFANEILLVPTWADADRETEEQVMETYRRLLPECKIVGIDAGQLGMKAGALRCATMPLHRVPPRQKSPPDSEIRGSNLPGQPRSPSRR